MVTKLMKIGETQRNDIQNLIPARLSPRTTIAVQPQTTIYADYGADTVIARGHNVQYNGNCVLVTDDPATITAPTSVGLSTWQ